MYSSSTSTDRVLEVGGRADGNAMGRIMTWFASSGLIWHGHGTV